MGAKNLKYGWSIFNKKAKKNIVLPIIHVYLYKNTRNKNLLLEKNLKVENINSVLRQVK